MGGQRQQIFMCLVLAMFLGTAVYLKLWSIDYSASIDDTEILRRQFDLANREAMDESAEWRLRYDEQVEKVTKCMNEVQQIKESFRKVEETISIKQKLTKLQKENAVLHETVEALKQELETEKLRCNRID